MAARRRIRFGIIGLGLMGREFGSAMLSAGPVPGLAGICDTSEKSHAWFTDNFCTINVATWRYEELMISERPARRLFVVTVGKDPDISI